MGRLLDMLAEHGIAHVYLPSYSDDQQDRHPAAHKFLIKGIQALTKHPALMAAYRKHNYGIRYYGDVSYLPKELHATIQNPPRFHRGDAEHFIYYGIDGGNPYSHLFKLSHQFSLMHGRAPSWDDMLELYYGDRGLQPLDILVAFSRIYARLGIPPLLDGNDRIYATAVTPLELNETQLRKILYDRIFNTQDRGRMYTDVHPNELARLKRFYAANQDTVIGLTQKYEDLCYPLPAPVWPAEMGK
jgi:hypothetical protein